MSDQSVSHRECSVCQDHFPLTSEFWHKDGKGFCYTCKACARKRARKWEVDNAEYLSERNRLYYAENKERVHKPYRAQNAEHIADWKREWRKKNPDKVKKHKSDSQKRNRASANKRASRYTKRHPDRINARTRNRYARKVAAEGTHTDTDIASHYETQNGLCAYCGIRLFDAYHVDHYIPLVKGGSNWPDNLLLSCMTCNISKNGLLFEEWQERRGW